MKRITLSAIGGGCKNKLLYYSWIFIMKVAVITLVAVIITIGIAITMLSTWDIPAPSSIVERDISNEKLLR